MFGLFCHRSRLRRADFEVFRFDLCRAVGCLVVFLPEAFEVGAQSGLSIGVERFERLLCGTEVFAEMLDDVLRWHIETECYRHSSHFEISDAVGETFADHRSEETTSE